MFKKKKDKSRKAPHIHATRQQREAWEWCVKNKISICVTPEWNNTGSWRVEISMKDKINISMKIQLNNIAIRDKIKGINTLIQD